MEPNTTPPVHTPVFLIEVDKIKPNPHQPRRDFNEAELKELASSIREYGVIQPLTVSKIEHETESGTEVEYQLIAGERRWLASKIAGLERVPAIIRNIALDRERLELAIIENVQRANLNPIESARAYTKLQDQFNLTQREIASRIGKSRETIANSVRLLNLPSEVQDAVAASQISESQARLLLSVPDMAEQKKLFQDIITNNLSVRELKSRIRSNQISALPTTEASQSTISADPETLAAQKELEEFLGTPVKLEKSGTTGKITISFYSKEELQEIMSKLLEKKTDNEIPSSQSIPPSLDPAAPVL